jgi:MFS family permease
MAGRDVQVPPAEAGGPGLGAGGLWTLLAGNALTQVGLWFFLPILPLYVRERGGAPLLVGLVFAAGIAGSGLAQYPAGWLADRVGRRPLMVGSLLVFALVFPVYLLPMPVAALAAVRFVHSLVGGAFTPAALALAADLTRPESRGRVFSQLRGSDSVGLLLGPALGGLLAGIRLEYVFLAGAVISLVAMGLVRRLPAGRAPALAAAEAAGAGAPVRPLRLLWTLLPVVAMAAPVAWTFGTYGAVWSLYLTSRGATPFTVGLSFVTYALPVVVFAGITAGLADRLGHVRAGAVALLTLGLLAATYPLVSSVPALILIGLAEGSLTAACVPALNAETSRLAPPGAQGRTQGLYQLVFNSAEVAGAAAGGALYGIGFGYPFYCASAVCLLGVAGSLLIRRARAG